MMIDQTRWDLPRRDEDDTFDLDGYYVWRRIQRDHAPVEQHLNLSREAYRRAQEAHDDQPR